MLFVPCKLMSRKLCPLILPSAHRPDVRGAPLRRGSLPRVGLASLFLLSFSRPWSSRVGMPSSFAGRLSYLEPTDRDVAIGKAIVNWADEQHSCNVPAHDLIESLQRGPAQAFARDGLFQMVCTTVASPGFARPDQAVEARAAQFLASIGEGTPESPTRRLFNSISNLRGFHLQEFKDTSGDATQRTRFLGLILGFSELNV